MANVSVVAIPLTPPLTPPPTAAGGWQWLLPLVAGILIAAFVMAQADACNEPRDPSSGIPAHSTKPMKD